MKTILTRNDYNEFLIYLYLGSGDYLNSCIYRAYRDFSRTLHGIRKNELRDEIDQQVVLEVRYKFGNLQRINSQTSFDEWHQDFCHFLCTFYQERGFSTFYIGQAQKWINMTFKYIFVIGEEKLAGFSPVYPFCHVPLDNILIGQLKKYGFPSLSTAWSRISNYEEYMERQVWIREHFDLVPLDVEFLLWMGKEIPETNDTPN